MNKSGSLKREANKDGSASIPHKKGKLTRNSQSASTSKKSNSVQPDSEFTISSGGFRQRKPVSKYSAHPFNRSKSKSKCHPFRKEIQEAVRQFKWNCIQQSVSGGSYESFRSPRFIKDLLASVKVDYPMVQRKDIDIWVKKNSWIVDDYEMQPPSWLTASSVSIQNSDSAKELSESISTSREMSPCEGPLNKAKPCVFANLPDGFGKEKKFQIPEEYLPAVRGDFGKEVVHDSAFDGVENHPISLDTDARLSDTSTPNAKERTETVAKHIPKFEEPLPLDKTVEKTIEYATCLPAEKEMLKNVTLKIDAVKNVETGKYETKDVDVDFISEKETENMQGKVPALVVQAEHIPIHNAGIRNATVEPKNITWGKEFENVEVKFENPAEDVTGYLEADTFTFTEVWSNKDPYPEAGVDFEGHARDKVQLSKLSEIDYQNAIRLNEDGSSTRTRIIPGPSGPSDTRTHGLFLADLERVKILVEGYMTISKESHQTFRPSLSKKPESLSRHAEIGCAMSMYENEIRRLFSSLDD